MACPLLLDKPRMRRPLAQPYDESALLTRLRLGDKKGFDELYERFSPNFLEIIIEIVQNTQQAEDLLQDAFVKIWRNLPQYDQTKGRLFTWMLTIVRNTALSYLRAANPAAHSLSDLSLELIDVLTPSYQRIEQIGLLSWVNSLLSRKERDVIHLMYFQGYTFQEISDKLGLPLGSVKTCVRRALQKLRNNL